MKKQQKMGLLSTLVVLALGSFGVPQNVWAGGTVPTSEITQIQGDKGILVTKEKISDESAAEEVYAVVIKNTMEITGSGRAEVTQDSETGDYTINVTSQTVSGSGAVNVSNDGSGNYTVGVTTGAITSKSNSVLATTLGVYNYLQTTTLGLAGGTAYGTNTLAIGSGAKSYDETTIAIGASSKASQWGDIAIGESSIGDGMGATAVGQYAKAQAASATAIGNYANAKKGYAVAIGYATAEEKSAIAVGTSAKASTASSIAMGSSATTSGESAIAFGSSASASGDKSFATGYWAKATAEGANVLGGYGTASETNALALGQWANSSATDAVAIGAESTATMGIETIADGTKIATVSFGHKAGEFSGWYVKDDGSTKTYSSVPSTGYGAYNYETDKLSRLTNIAYGVTNTDAATYGQLIKAVDGGYKVASTNANTAQSVELEYNDGSSSMAKVKITVEGDGEVASGDKRLVNGGTVYDAIAKAVGSAYSGSDTIAISSDRKISVKNMAMSSTWESQDEGAVAAPTATGAFAFAIGGGSSASGMKTMALGLEANASEEDAMAFGSWAKATAVDAIAIGCKSEASLEGAVAVGRESKSTGEIASAYGYKSAASKTGAVALGSFSEASGEYAAAVGTQSVAKGNYASAFGVLSQATVDGATAFGYASKATNAAALAIGGLSQASGNGSAAVGYGSISQGDASIAFGAASKAYSNAAYGMALGVSAETQAENAVAIGYQAVANAANTVSFGHKNGDSYMGVNSQGEYETMTYDSDSFATLTNVKPGQKNNEAATWDQLVKNKEYTFDANGVATIETNESTDTDKKVAFTLKLAASGSIEADNGGYITGGTVYSYLTPANAEKVATDGEYVNAAQTTGQNLYALDTQVKTNADAISAIDTRVTNLETNVGKIQTTIGNVKLLTDGLTFDFSDGKTTDTQTISYIDGNGTSKTFDIKISGLPTGGGNYTAGNGIAINNETDEISVKLAENSGLTVDANGLSVQKDGKVESGNTGLVTGGTVYDALQDMNSRTDELTNDINKVGAGAAALAALRPEGFHPDDKWSFAVGYGHYKNANAGAIGAFFKPNADTTLSVGGTIGNGDSMMNAGVSFKLGSRSAKSAYRGDAAVSQELASLRKNNDKLTAQTAAQQKEISALRAANERMQKQIEMIFSQMKMSNQVTKTAK